MTSRQQSPFSSVWGVIVGVALLFALFILARGIFNLLALAAPFLLIGALIVNYKTVINYGKWIVNQLSSNTIVGIEAIILTIVAFPLAAAFLFGKSFLDRKIGKVMDRVAQRSQEEYVEYEEVQEEYDTLELDTYQEVKEKFKTEFDQAPEPKPEKEKIEKNDYEDLFD